MDTSLAVLVIVFFINISLGVFILLRDKSKIANQLFFLMTLSIVAWALFNYFASYPFPNTEPNDVANRLAYFTAFLIPISGLAFTYHYPLRYVPSARERYVVVVITVMVGLLSLTSLIAGHVASIDQKLVFSAGSFVSLFIASFLGLVALSCRNLLHAIHAGTRRVGAQGKYILFGFTVTAVIGLSLNVVLPAVFSAWSFTSFGPLTTIILVGAISYSMYHHGLFDIRAFFVRAFAYSITMALVVSLYLLPIVLLIMWFLGKSYSGLNIILVLAAAFLVAVLYNPVRHIFNKLTNTVFFRDAYDPTLFLLEFNKSLIKTISLKGLLEGSSRVMMRYINPEFMTVVLADSATGQYEVLSQTDKVVRDFPVGDVQAIKHTAPGDVLVSGALGPALRSKFEESVIGAMIGLDLGDSRDDSRGYLILGARKNGKSYSPKDIQTISTASSTLAIAIQNALRIDEIREFNENLQERIEEQVRKYRVANEKLRKLDETKDEFISMASHQLRTPLTSVKGYLSMVLEGDVGELNAQQKDLLKQSYLSSQRMVNLIADLLNLSRLNTGKFVIDSHPTDLRMIVDQEIVQLAESAKAKNIQLVWDMPPTLGLTLLDEGKMHQVIMNFIDNAIYYTPEGGTVVVTLVETAKDFEFRVRDSGIGVPRAQQYRLFTKFYRADNARRVRPDGTGLGLYMAKKIILAQGGSIIFESEEGQGSTFGFSFSKGLSDVMPARTRAKRIASSVDKTK